MFSTKKTNFLMLALVCFLVFSMGCEEKTKPGSAISKPEPAKAAPAEVKSVEPLAVEKADAKPVEVKPADVKPVDVESCKAEGVKVPALVLNFADKALDVYKVTTEYSKGVAFEGEVSDKSSFRGGKTGSDIEIVFSSEVVSVDPQGNAVEKIAINSVKYKAFVKDNPVVDFDSSREKDKVSPLFGLIGKSYTIKMAANGKMLSVFDANEIRQAVAGGSSTHKAAQSLVSDEIIAQRHGSVILPGDEKVAADTTWKELESFDFGLMGTQTYEKVYKVDSADDAKSLTVSMNGLPSSEKAEEIHKEQKTSDFSKMFDNNESYAGKLVFDSAAGKVKSYSEKLDASWLAVDPAAGKADPNGVPAALTMSVVKGFSIEKVN